MELCLYLSPGKFYVETLHNARTGATGLLDLERLCNLEPRTNSVEDILVSQYMDPYLDFFIFSQRRKLKGRGKDSDFQKEVMSQHLLQERGLLLSLFLLRILGNPETRTGPHSCMLSEPQQWDFNSEPWFKLSILQSNRYRALPLRHTHFVLWLTSTYTLIGLCTTHTHTHKTCCKLPSLASILYLILEIKRITLHYRL